MPPPIRHFRTLLGFAAMLCVATAAAQPAPRRLPPVSDTKRFDRDVVTAAARTTELAHPAAIASEHVAKPDLRERATATAPAQELYPIDLANALALGGASNLQVRLARSRVYEAQADYLRAKAQWLPSLQLTIAYNNHAGRLQETEGDVLEISRSSLFAGGGIGPAGVGPLTAGAGGPPRAFVNWSLADAAFEPLVACRLASAAGAASVATLNDELLGIATSYFDLVESFGMLANARQREHSAHDLVGTLRHYRESGLASTADMLRAQTALAAARRVTFDTQRQTRVRSAVLARRLRLPPQLRLTPVEEAVLPVDFVSPDEPVDALIARAVAARPELSRQQQLQQAACYRVRQERLRPWLPSLHVGLSGGAFGGGPGSDFPNADGRSDLDVIAVWQLENLGVGNAAALRQRRSQLHQRELELLDLRERIGAEVAAAAADTVGYRQQTVAAREAIRFATEALQMETERIHQGEGEPVELLASIEALGAALDEYTRAAAEHNKSQYRLMHAIGAAPVSIEGMRQLGDPDRPSGTEGADLVQPAILAP